VLKTATVRLTPVTVDDRTNKGTFDNGITGLKRDIIMRLVNICCDVTKTRNIFGISNVFYEWSKNKNLQWAIKNCFLYIELILFFFSLLVNKPLRVCTKATTTYFVAASNSIIEREQSCPYVSFVLCQELTSGIYKVFDTFIMRFIYLFFRTVQSVGCPPICGVVAHNMVNGVLDHHAYVPLHSFILIFLVNMCRHVSYFS
jgi:hypothetical protein